MARFSAPPCSGTKATRCVVERLTEDPEHEADLDARHEDVLRAERGLEHDVDLGGVLDVGVAELQHLGRVVRDRIRLLVEPERGGSEQDEEAEMRQRVRDELGRRTAQRVTDLYME